jgi:hypothetical protein
VTFRLTTRPGHPTFVDLPWEAPLASWDIPRLVAPVRGISRHVVRFVAYGGAMYALKELPDALALREHGLLRALGDDGAPVVEVIGTVTGRRDEAGEDLEGILITRHLEFALPYRTIFRQATQHVWEPMLDGLVELLVRLHLGGFYWGDCSLSNALFRRDAGELSAWLVDAETGERHAQLSDGQRRLDLEIAMGNVGGDLLDLAAAREVSADLDPADVAEELVRRYERLWSELTSDLVFPSWDDHALYQRVQRLNELGFDVLELELEAVGDGQFRLHLATRVVEPGHHRRRLLALTGVDAQENQARRMLNDIRRFRAQLERRDTVVLSEQVAALRWMVDYFEPTIARVPGSLRAKLEPAEVFHQVLEHRWFLSEQAGADVGTEAAVDDYVASILAGLPDERAVLGSPATGSVPRISS